MKTEPIEIEIYKPSTEKPGYLTYDHSRTIGEIHTELKARLKADGIEDEGITLFEGDRNDPWPSNYRWISCFAVTGGSEGHYVHVEAILQPKRGEQQLRRRLIFLLKTFGGLEHAYKLAYACARHLGA